MKTYQKPVIVYEALELSQSIADNCGNTDLTGLDPTVVEILNGGEPRRVEFADQTVFFHDAGKGGCSGFQQKGGKDLAALENYLNTVLGYLGS